jgi:hypothetical protein
MGINREKGMAPSIGALLLDRCCIGHSVQGWGFPLPKVLISLFASLMRFADRLLDLSLQHLPFKEPRILTQAHFTDESLGSIAVTANLAMAYGSSSFNTHRRFNPASTKPSLSSRTMAIIASQPQPQDSTTKTGKDPDYRNSQVGQRLPEGKPKLGVGHLSAGPAAGSYPNINHDQQDQRTTDPW